MMMKKVAFAAIIGIFLATSVLGIWVISCEKFLSDTQMQNKIQIHKGQTFQSIYNTVFGDLDTPPFFRWYLIKILKFDKKVRFGYYQADDISLRQYIENITTGKESTTKVTIPEGYNLFDIAKLLDSKDILKKEAFIEACFNKELLKELTGMDIESIEGFLYPSTYMIPIKSNPKDVMTELVRTFFKNVPETFEADAQKLGLTFYQALTLSSIIQKETYEPEEFRLVASVFINRLRKNMRLQADPTVIYGNYMSFDGNIRKSDLHDRSNVYNTYRHGGLTPTPICNPSKEVMEAAVTPSRTRYLYFVADKEGKHQFSENYRQHRRQVNIHQKQ